MRLRIRHRTVYRYESPAEYAAQILRMTPRSHDALTVLSWRVTPDAGGRLADFVDGFANLSHVLTVARRHQGLAVTVEGVVETSTTDGTVRGTEEPLPPAIYLRVTPLTAASDDIHALAAESAKNADSLSALLHRLMHLVRERVTYRPGATHVGTTAAEALVGGAGVCQDHAHVFIAAARSLGIPARYVGGYLCLEERDDEQEAGHAWVEAFHHERGWLGLDPANGTCPGERHVRTSVGLDYASAAPVRGVRRGTGYETLQVGVQVARLADQ
jgi:transglutaminase-like putative cysteine protease